MRYSGIGGQAVIEGVMMKGKEKYAVSVRKMDGEIETKVEACKSLKDKYAVCGFPVIRGVVSFAESVVLGMKTLNYSSSFFEEEEEREQKKKQEDDGAKSGDKKNDDKKNELLMGLVVMAAVMLAIGLFVLLPFFVSELLSGTIRSVHLRGLIEGVIRVALFVGYVKAISHMEDIHRVFMYHGAEHKCINCIENGEELNVPNAMRQTTVHKRCGTSFMLVVMFVSILFFMFISVSNIWLRMVLRILLIPFIAGISYEFIILAGKYENPVVNVLSKPGLWLQSLTTAEPDSNMIQVAIASVEAVFDWKKFLSEEEQAPETAQPAAAVEHAAAQEKEAVQKKEATQKKEAVTDEADGFEVVDISAEDEEEDEILQALDRYFEDPGAPDKGQAK